MYIGSTPTQKFILPNTALDIEKLRVTYAQNGDVVFEKKLSDARIDGNTVYIDLSIEDTSKFVFGRDAQIQMEIITTNKKKLISPIYEVPIERVLNKDILV